MADIERTFNRKNLKLADRRKLCGIDPIFDFQNRVARAVEHVLNTKSLDMGTALDLYDGLLSFREVRDRVEQTIADRRQNPTNKVQ